jgi:hypothetical protein
VDDEALGGFLVTAFVPTACVVEETTEATEAALLAAEAGSR